MVTADEIRKILKEEYGIMNDQDFLTAYNNMQKINIGPFVSPVVRS